MGRPGWRTARAVAAQDIDGHLAYLGLIDNTGAIRRWEVVKLPQAHEGAEGQDGNNGQRFPSFLPYPGPHGGCPGSPSPAFGPRETIGSQQGCHTKENGAILHGTLPVGRGRKRRRHGGDERCAQGHTSRAFCWRCQLIAVASGRHRMRAPARQPCPTPPPWSGQLVHRAAARQSLQRCARSTSPR